MCTAVDRFADKEGITDNELKDAVKRLEKGQVDADLGGGVYKVRVARSGEGKSGGYRLIVFFRSEERTFFVCGFAKSDRDNIDEGELRVYKKRAKEAFLLYARGTYPRTRYARELQGALKGYSDF